MTTHNAADTATALRVFLTYFSEDDDDTVIESVHGHMLTVGMLRAAVDKLDQPKKPIVIGTGMPAASHLEAFGQILREAFGAMPYQVGSSITGKVWRDIDVRIMLDDDRFDALFPGYASWGQRDAWWNLLCSGIAELARKRTGLPVDFQVQRVSDANAKFPGPRNPLFVNRAGEQDRPAMIRQEGGGDGG